MKCCGSFTARPDLVTVSEIRCSKSTSSGFLSTYSFSCPSWLSSSSTSVWAQLLVGWLPRDRALLVDYKLSVLLVSQWKQILLCYDLGVLSQYLFLVHLWLRKTLSILHTILVHSFLWTRLGSIYQAYPQFPFPVVLSHVSIYFLSCLGLVWVIEYTDRGRAKLLRSKRLYIYILNQCQTIFTHYTLFNWNLVLLSHQLFCSLQMVWCADLIAQRQGRCFCLLGRQLIPMDRNLQSRCLISLGLFSAKLIIRWYKCIPLTVAFLTLYCQHCLKRTHMFFFLFISNKLQTSCINLDSKFDLDLLEVHPWSVSTIAGTPYNKIQVSISVLASVSAFWFGIWIAFTYLVLKSILI